MAVKPRVRKYRQVDESIVLDRIAAGTLKVDTTRGAVFLWDLREKCWREATYYPCHRGYSWIRICYQGARRGVAVHRAVWIVANNRLIPEDSEIHHKKGKWAGDGIKNLELKTNAQHKALHYGYPDGWDGDWDEEEAF